MRYFRNRLIAVDRRAARLATLDACCSSLRKHHVDTWLIGESLEALRREQAMQGSCSAELSSEVECFERWERLELGVYYNDLYCLRSLKWDNSDYLLDINPNHIARRPQVRNQVDARFVDKRNGVFVDLYGFHPTDDRQVLSDKRSRKLHVNDLFPLVPCELAGIPVMRPRNVDGIVGTSTSHFASCATNDPSSETVISTVGR